MKPKTIFSIFITILIVSTIQFYGLAQTQISFDGRFNVHDPVMIKQDSTYYLFVTGGGMAKSTDMIHWSPLKPVLEKPLDWVTEEIIPDYRGGYWAPDIQYLNGKYYLYYSPSAFAKNTSAIGVMTNTTLNQNDPEYKWEDHGMIVQSVPNRDFWNAIDANVYFERGFGSTTGWLLFGSFWGGIKMVKLAPDMISLAKPEEWYSLAQQERTFGMPDTDPGDGTIEAPFLYKGHQYYYLFVSLNYCCRGLESDYNVVVGRSRNIEGPYFDKDGVPLYAGGGTFVIGETENYAAIGHCAVYDFDGKTFLIAHGYDKHDNGRSKLVIKEIKWDRSEWPVIEE